MKKPKLKCDIMFQKKEEYNIADTRFTKVKIWLMHLGINHNGSNFSKQVVKDAIPTLANTPILGYIEKTENDKDFLDHRMEIEFKDNNEKKYIYKGQAYGVIPESNNAHFEKRLCDDGVEREFLVVDGLLWNKLSDAVDILNRDLWKSQSMELADNDGDYDGEYDENCIYHFKKFKFYGACFLGNSYEPAMENATIELAFNKVNDTIKEQLRIFNKFIQEKGGIILEKEKNKKLTQCEDEKNKQDDTLEGAISTTTTSINTDTKNENKEEKKETEKSSLKYELELRDKEKEIKSLKYELELRDKKIEEISNEYTNYKNEIELEKKKELLEKYEDMISNCSEYRELVDEKKLNEYSLENLQIKLDSIVGKMAYNQHNFNKGKISETKHYFEDERMNFEYNNSYFGGIVDRLMGRK